MQLRALNDPGSMSSAAETGFNSIFIPIVDLRMLTVRSVIFDICEISVLLFTFIPCDTDE